MLAYYRFASVRFTEFSFIIRLCSLRTYCFVIQVSVLIVHCCTENKVLLLSFASFRSVRLARAHGTAARRRAYNSDIFGLAHESCNICSASGGLH